MYRTVCVAAATEDGISAGIFDCAYDRAGGSGAFDEDQLVFEVCLDFINSCRGVSLAQGAFWNSVS